MILIGLGANLPSRYGEPEETLKKALERLEQEGCCIIQASSVWKSAPVPVSDQPWYRNAVAHIQTDLSAGGLLELLQAIELDFGRVRSVRNAPRLLDLDIIAYHDEVHSTPFCSIPHPRMHQRAFVLRPLHEIAPDWMHPVLGLGVSELIEKLPADQQVDISQFKAA